MSAEHRAAAILAELPAGPVRMAEIGVHRGELSALILQKRSDISLVMVDRWCSDFDYPDDRAGDYGVAMARIRPFVDRVQVVRADSVYAATLFPERIFELVFIDADHRYESVRADIHAWRSRVRAGGVLGGHDYRTDKPRFAGVKQAVDELFRDGLRLGDNHTWFVSV